MGDFNNAAHHSEHSVLVIAAALSIAGAVKIRPEGPERTPELPAAVRPEKKSKRKAGAVTIAHRKSGLHHHCPGSRCLGFIRAHARWSGFLPDPSYDPSISIRSRAFARMVCFFGSL